jgi:hypothetical protein
MDASTFSVGAKVETTEPNESLRKEWLPGVWEQRQWGIVGTIVSDSNAHGVSYEVQHADGSIGFYDPSELKGAPQVFDADNIHRSRQEEVG